MLGASCVVVENLYVHFPFCRTKCSYCALYSRTGVSPADRDAYVRRILAELFNLSTCQLVNLSTVYLGGGSPALCNLSVLAPVLRPLCDERTEFTVELHPLDVTEAKLGELRSIGVNRISMGVQALDDATLAAMGRGYTVDEAERAFALVKKHFDNAGIDLIVGFPGDEVEVKGGGGRWNIKRLSDWGLTHCSVYALQNERGLKNVPDDDVVMDCLRHVATCLRDVGLERYEISNYAVPGFECQHNMAVWRGEDYLGLGEGACGRVGLKRTKGLKSGYSESVVTPEEDAKERTIFRLRTREGLDASRFPEWGQTLQKHVQEGLLAQSGSIYRLTERGMEVCDSILTDLV